MDENTLNVGALDDVQAEPATEEVVPEVAPEEAPEKVEGDVLPEDAEPVV